MYMEAANHMYQLSHAEQDTHIEDRRKYLHLAIESATKYCESFGLEIHGYGMEEETSVAGRGRVDPSYLEFLQELKEELIVLGE